MDLHDDRSNRTLDLAEEETGTTADGESNARALATTSAADAAGARDALDQYMRSIRDIPLLDHEEMADLSRIIRRSEEEFREALYGIVAAGRWVVESWHARRAEGRVTGVMAATFRDVGKRGRGETAKIDRAMRKVEGILEQGGRGVRKALRPALLDAGLSLDVDLEAYDWLSGQKLSAATDRAAMRRAEAALARRDAARRRFVEHNLKLVLHVAKGYRTFGVPLLDLIQEGNLGLIRAVEKFDAERGFRFSTYAVWWIEQALIRAIQRSSRTVRLPAHVYDQQRAMRRAEQALAGRTSTEPDAQQVSAASGLPEDAIEQLSASMAPIRSMTSPIPGTDGATLEDALEDESTVDLEELNTRREVRSVLERELPRLSERERSILSWRYGLVDEVPQTLDAIGEKLGLSRERVRQIESLAIQKLRGRSSIGALAGAFDVGLSGG